MNFTKTDIGLAGAMLLCGFLYWDLLFTPGMGLGVTIFTTVLCLSAWVYFRMSGIRQTKESIFFLAVSILASIPFFLFDNIMIKMLDFVFLSVSFVLWICFSTGRQMGSKLSVYLIGDLISQLLIVPFSNFGSCFKGVTGVSKNLRQGKGILAALIGIIVFLPVLAVVVNQLTAADAAFEHLIDSIHFSFSADVLRYFMEALLGIPVAFYLYGLVYGDRYGLHTEHITPEALEKNAAAFRVAPGSAVYAALTALNAVYLLFFLAQAAYLFSAFGNSLPETMTYAEYARRGFFELCTVAGINLCVIVLTQLITKRKVSDSTGEKPSASKMLRVESAVLCVFTMLLIATALSKMGMYINYYGLTQLRVYTTWFMVLLFIVFAVTLLRQFKNFNGTRILAVSFVLLFLTLCLGNADGMIAKYNIERYREGTLETLDINDLGRLSDAAVPYLFQLYKETSEPMLKEELRAAMLGADYPDEVPGESETFAPTFRDFNLQTYNADKIRETLLLSVDQNR